MNETKLNSTQQLLSYLFGKPWKVGGSVPTTLPMPEAKAFDTLNPTLDIPKHEMTACPVVYVEQSRPYQAPDEREYRLPAARKITSLDDLGPDEIEVVLVMAFNGFLHPATIARKAQVPVNLVTELASVLSFNNLLLNIGKKITLNVYAKQRLGLVSYD